MSEHWSPETFRVPVWLPPDAIERVKQTTMPSLVSGDEEHRHLMLSIDSIKTSASPLVGFDDNKNVISFKLPVELNAKWVA